MPLGHTIIEIDRDGNRTVHDYIYAEQLDAKGDVLKLGKMNPHLTYLTGFTEVEAERIHDTPRFHPKGRFHDLWEEDR